MWRLPSRPTISQFMPELPEVENIRRQLAHVAGPSVLDACISLF